MSQKRVLTKEIAEQIIKDENLVEFTEIDDDAAEVLANFWEEEDFHEPEYLNGLTKLSDAAAQSLSRIYLDLMGLTALGFSGHLALAERLVVDGGDVWLDSLTTISDAAAEILSKASESLSFSGLKTLSDAAAESFSKCKGEYIYLGGLTELGDSSGHLSLARSLKPGMPDSHSDEVLFYEPDVGEAIYLPRLTKLSDAAAQSLPKDYPLDLRSLLS